jgi:hypothetical protein
MICFDTMSRDTAQTNDLAMNKTNVSFQSTPHERASRLQIQAKTKAQSPGEEGAKVRLRDQRSDGSGPSAGDSVGPPSSDVAADATPLAARQARPEQGTVSTTTLPFLPVCEDSV